MISQEKNAVVPNFFPELYLTYTPSHKCNNSKKSMCEYFLLKTDLTSLCLAFVYSAMFAEEQKVCPLALIPNFHCKHLHHAVPRSA